MTSRIVRTSLVVASLVTSLNAWASSDVASDRYFKRPPSQRAVPSAPMEAAQKDQQNREPAKGTHAKHPTCSCPVKA